ncbi:uncharacterized protein P174DRAFT_440934 [Aspergillus novofumigatus IBT 16806]|uniref:Uncharacterized protein n=1 Tax=Aspergillus novofumigatus (strain IBT 16806) TaxID=1392255 RepID=A0A2I1C7Q7_ASPN1|nr:uncharacterized protein P174DRAFT_440934 [Aspergillus novofumigatus IBT 16806]PKX93669.1 hypothetical protein P174DRAFT_440934 [Aspergillus novofumigatus IBT 16806]
MPSIPKLRHFIRPLPSRSTCSLYDHPGTIGSLVRMDREGLMHCTSISVSGMGSRLLILHRGQEPIHVRGRNLCDWILFSCSVDHNSTSLGITVSESVDNLIKRFQSTEDPSGALECADKLLFRLHQLFTRRSRISDRPLFVALDCDLYHIVPLVKPQTEPIYPNQLSFDRATTLHEQSHPSQGANWHPVPWLWH